jgi:hypothetical protein
LQKEALFFFEKKEPKTSIYDHDSVDDIARLPQRRGRSVAEVACATPAFARQKKPSFFGL